MNKGFDLSNNDEDERLGINRQRPRPQVKEDQQ